MVALFKQVEKVSMVPVVIEAVTTKPEERLYRRMTWTTFNETKLISKNTLNKNRTKLKAITKLRTKTRSKA